MLKVDVDKVNSLKYIRQLRAVGRWIEAGAKGSITASTGFGKSFMGLLAIIKLKKKVPNAKCLIVVPSLALKVQWEEHINRLEIVNCVVLVINSVALKERTLNVDLLILDEEHLYLADQFVQVFTKVSYKWIMGLTATRERLDGRHTLLDKWLPVVDVITKKECIEKGWITDLIRINLAVKLSSRERTDMEELDKQVRWYLDKFQDYKLMQACKDPSNAKLYAGQYLPNEDIEQATKKVVGWAMYGDKLIRRRKEFLYTTQHKIDAAVKIVNTIKLKTIMFGESTEFANVVAEKIGPRAVSYHSNIKSEMRLSVKTKSFKRLDAAERFRDKVGGELKEEKGVYVVCHQIPEKFGSDRIKKEALDCFKRNDCGIDVIVTARALNVGFDDMTVELGVDSSRTRDPGASDQKRGRLSRTYTYRDGTKKRGVYICLYIPDTQDEKWLRESQKNDVPGTVWLDSMSQVITYLKEELNGVNMGFADN